VKYTPTDLAGVMIVDIEPDRDDRGFFTRSFCSDEFNSQGLISPAAQTNISYNYARGTLRGLHRQGPPHAEAKLVRCTRGAIVDVAVDVRPESRTYRKHVMVQLSADNRRALFLPPYVAHGFQTLADNTEVLCQVSGSYASADCRASVGMTRNSASHGRWRSPSYPTRTPAGRCWYRSRAWRHDDGHR